VVELDGDEHHANGDPYDGQANLSSMRNCTAPYLEAAVSIVPVRAKSRES
jgi:hypothetical protein